MDERPVRDVTVTEIVSHPEPGEGRHAVEPKTNPYVEQLAQELRDASYPTAVAGADGIPIIAEVNRPLATYVAETLLAPKNKRIHSLQNELQALRAEIARLGKALDRYNAGEWHKDRESAVACATRMLSPVRDDTPTRDRP